jgi:hypothetical protein
MTSFYKKKKIHFPVPWLSAKVFNHECTYKVKKVSNNMQVIQNRLTNMWQKPVIKARQYVIMLQN